MKIHYLGNVKKRDEKLKDFPCSSIEHKPNAEKPPKLPKFYYKIELLLNVIIGLTLLFFTIHHGKLSLLDQNDLSTMLVAAIVALILVYLHELIHALCMGGDVFMFYSIKDMSLLVTSFREYTKTHYVIMKLLPNILLGFIPFIVFLIFPKLVFIGIIGGLQISVGINDYATALRCLLCLPKGWKIYIHKDDGIFWYKPE